MRLPDPMRTARIRPLLTNGTGTDMVAETANPMNREGSDKGKAMTDNERRKLWRKWCEESRQASERWAARGYSYPPEPSTAMPPEVYGLTCGAKTRAGTPCKLTSIYENGRCKFHGGLSTGPRTPEGKAVAARNGLVPKRKPSILATDNGEVLGRVQGCTALTEGARARRLHQLPDQEQRSPQP